MTYIQFITDEFDGKIIYVNNTKYNEHIGEIYYYPGWRKVVFEPYNDTIFTPDCLREIADYIEGMKRK